MWTWLPSLIPSALETTKLGLAVLATYPETPSYGDMRTMKKLGYTSVFEVVQAAEEHGLPQSLAVRKGQAALSGIRIPSQRIGD